MAQRGDVARRLGLHKHGANLGPGMHRPSVTHSTHIALSLGGTRSPHFGHWHVPHHSRGRISPRYGHGCLPFYYHGPFYWPHYCWYPRWTDWVRWSWHFHRHGLWDPRPLWCRPVVYVAAPRWIWWEVPVWDPLPEVTCGTWIDVPQPVVIAPQYDLQLLAVRFVDPGHPEEQLGPRYRVWLRNNSRQAIPQPFDVVLLASNAAALTADVPQAGVRVTSIEAGQVQSVDVRLPVEVYSLGLDDEGRPAPFTTLHVLIDAGREVSETSETNNGLKLAPEQILPVDPAAFELQPTAAAPGGEVVLAGEGLGPEPGQVLLHLGGIEMEAEILGWYDLGVRLKLPELPLAGPTPAELIVVRGDGAAANPLQITMTPSESGPELIPSPPAVPQ